MFTKRITASAAIFSLSLFATAPSFANLNSQFSECASTALEAKNVSAGKISIDLESKYASAFDHDFSSKTRELKMVLENPKSGKSLGTISCRVNSDGAIESVRYLTQAS